MKKMAKFLAVLLTMVLLVSSAGATVLSSNYYIEPLHLSVPVPGDYYVLTRDVAANDPVLADIGMDQASVLSFMEANQLYLDAIEPNVAYEFTVAMEANTIDNFNNYSDIVLRQVADTIPETFVELGMNVTKTELYKNDEASFIVIYYYGIDEYGDLNHVLQYFTVYDYQAINFRLFSYVGEITEENEQLLREVVDGSDFGRIF